MNDILISQLLPDNDFGGDGASGSRKYWFIAGTAGRTTRDSTGKPTYIEAGICQRTQVLRISQGETPSTRIIGLKTGTNPDGSYQIKLLANNVTYSQSRKFYTYGINSGISNNHPSRVADNTYSAGLINAPTPFTGGYGVSQNRVYYAGSTSYNGTISGNNAIFLSNDEISELYNIASYSTESNPCQIESNGNISSISSTTKITTDVNNTLEFGTKNLEQQYSRYQGGEVFIDPWFAVESDTGQIDPLLGYTGKNYEYVCQMLTKIEGKANAQQTNLELANRYTMFTDDNSLHFTPSDFYFGTRYDNLHITESYDKAIEYLNNGTIPDDDEYSERDPDNPNPYTNTPTAPENQVGNNNNQIPEHTTRAEYGIATSNNLTGINWYYIHKSILESFINWFWNDMTDWSSILMNWVTGLYGDLQNAIISLKKIHVADQFLLEDVNEGGRHNTTEIKLARFTCSLPTAGNYLQALDSELHGLKYVGGVYFSEIEEIYSFLQYNPYEQISLYLPYVGIVPIESRYFHPNKGKKSITVNIACGASYMTGEIIYRIQIGDCDVCYYQGKCSEDVPFSMNSAMQLATNTVNAIGNVSAGLIGGGVGVATTELLGQNVASPTTTNSHITSAMNKYLGTKCAFILQRPEYFKVYNTKQGLTVSAYAKSKGYKYNSTRTFSVGDGYAEFVNPHINNWETAPTETEIQEIYSLMESGIVL